MTAGDYRPIGDRRWHEVTAMTSIGDRLFLIDQRLPYQIDLADGGFRRVVDEYLDTTVLVGVDDGLYAVTDDRALYRIDPGDGAARRLSPDGEWARTTSGAGAPGVLYLVDGDRLYRVEPETGAFAELGQDAWNPRVMVVADGPCLVHDDGTLYRVADPDGSWTTIGRERIWADAVAGAAVDGTLYLVQQEYLYAVDLTTGADRRVSDEPWDATHVVGCGAALVIRTGDGNLYQVDVS